VARVLIIDDEDYVRMTLSQALEDEGHTVLLASNGLDGLSVYAEGKPDLVITDVLMPDKEGLETIIELRKIEPDVKVIVISGGGRVNNIDFLDMAKKFGATATLKKPFAIDEFCRIVQSCLAQAPASGRQPN
jgi:DNA-binding NtrC family response regulator